MQIDFRREIRVGKPFLKPKKIHIYRKRGEALHFFSMKFYYAVITKFKDSSILNKNKCH